MGSVERQQISIDADIQDGILYKCQYTGGYLKHGDHLASPIHCIWSFNLVTWILREALNSLMNFPCLTHIYYACWEGIKNTLSQDDNLEPGWSYGDLIPDTWVDT